MLYLTQFKWVLGYSGWGITVSASPISVCANGYRNWHAFTRLRWTFDFFKQKSSNSWGTATCCEYVPWSGKLHPRFVCPFVTFKLHTEVVVYHLDMPVGCSNSKWTQLNLKCVLTILKTSPKSKMKWRKWMGKATFSTEGWWQTIWTI